MKRERDLPDGLMESLNETRFGKSRDLGSPRLLPSKQLHRTIYNELMGKHIENGRQYRDEREGNQTGFNESRALRPAAS